MEKFKNISVEEFTTPSPIMVEATDTILDVKNKMTENNIRHVPVKKNGDIIGILTQRDVRLIESCFDDITSLEASTVMTPDPYVVEPSTPLDTVAFHMSKEKIGSAIVQSDAENYVGIFTSTDALNALLEVLRGQV